MTSQKSDRAKKSDMDEDLYSEMQLWVFQLAEDVSVKPRGVSLLPRRSDSGDHGSSVQIDQEERAWRNDAACRGSDLDIFYPKKGHSPLPAYSICCECPVRMTCLEKSLGEPFGIWGGFTERERQAIRKRVSEGMELEDAMETFERKKSRKLQSAVLRDSPALYHKGVRITPEDL